MTTHRALKHLVRERMTRTGETYSTAHRHVVGHAGGSAAILGHRESALARRMLAVAGIDVSEAMACGLGGGIGFLYTVFEYAELDHPLLAIVAQHHPTPWVDAVAEHLQLSAGVVTSSSTGPALKGLASAVEEAGAAWISVARGGLPWHENVSAEEAADPFALLVEGWADGEVTVLDRAEHRLSADELGVAWAAHRKGRFRITTFPRGSAGDVHAAARAAVRTTHAHLTGPVLGHAFDVNFGVSGLARLRDDVADVRTKRGWVRRFGDPAAYGVCLDRLAGCLTWDHSSPGATRWAYSEFLAEVGLDAAAALARAAGDQWVAIADRAGGALHEEPGAFFHELDGRLDAVLAVETDLVGALGAAI